MLLGVLIGRKTYTIQKYFLVFLIVGGVIAFSYKESKNVAEKTDHFTGMALIAAALLMDGLMGALQDRMRSVSKPTSLNLMFFINAWSSVYLALLLIFTLEGVEFINFCIRHPEVMTDLGVVILFGSVAQFFISQMVAFFGSLPLSLTMTIRKLISVFLSVLIYGNVIIIRQWIAATVIFSALILDAIFQEKSRDARATNHLENLQPQENADEEKQIEREQESLTHKIKA